MYDKPTIDLSIHYLCNRKPKYYKNMENLKTISQCLTADLTQDRVALHETGHVITMYALGMMDHFAYVTKKAGDGTESYGSNRRLQG